MANKYLTLIAGRDTLVTATVVSTGAPDAGEIVALDSTGKLDASIMPLGVIADVKVMNTTEALSAGAYVNIYNVAGTQNCRLADKSNDRPAHGFVLTAFLISTNATIYFEGANSGLSALTAGARMYLSTAGTASATPATTGLHQYLGVAISPTEINTDIDDDITIA
jgi:hypothetical protein